MKISTICFIFSVLLLSAVSLRASDNVRKIINFDSDWKFFLGNLPDLQDPSFKDSNWRHLDLPHDWSVEGKKDRLLTYGLIRTATQSNYFLTANRLV